MNKRRNFEITAECCPSDRHDWFDQKFEVIEDMFFSSREEAQDYIDKLCVEAGTDTDPYYEKYGPIAKELEDE